MNFTSKIKLGRVVSGVLTTAVVGLIGWFHYAVPAPAPTSVEQNSFDIQQSIPSDVILGMDREVAPMVALETAGGAYYQPVSSWYKNKHWWKRNAPIVGGAGGGALVGGLVGGGTGALIGGAVGGGGGYLYKRSRHHHHHYNK